MRISSFISAALLQVSIAWSSPVETNDLVTQGTSKRPNHPIKPHHPGKPFPISPARTKTCTVQSYGNGKDDPKSVLSAIKSCNNGGHGTIKFTNDTDYWQANAFKQVFQNASTFFQLGGEDVNVYGGGTFDGNGQVWYNLYAKNNLVLRPILFGTIGLKSGRIEDLNLRYSPQWYNLVANSTNVVFSDISISGYNSSSNIAKNTDGWDTYRSDNIVIQNSHIDNGDDCVSFKPNSTNIVVQNLICNGSHGISVGSLGQYKGEVDIVETSTHTTSACRTLLTVPASKSGWPGVSSALSEDLQGGGGLGAVPTSPTMAWCSPMSTTPSRSPSATANRI
ncbi:hypothetical protein PMIN02_004296 [Paraphaeosphaeria minitans]